MSHSNVDNIGRQIKKLLLSLWLSLSGGLVSAQIDQWDSYLSISYERYNGQIFDGRFVSRDLDGRPLVRFELMETFEAVADVDRSFETILIHAFIDQSAASYIESIEDFNFGAAVQYKLNFVGGGLDIWTSFGEIDRGYIYGPEKKIFASDHIDNNKVVEGVPDPNKYYLEKLWFDVGPIPAYGFGYRMDNGFQVNASMTYATVEGADAGDQPHVDYRMSYDSENSNFAVAAGISEWDRLNDDGSFRQNRKQSFLGVSYTFDRVIILAEYQDYLRDGEPFADVIYVASEYDLDQNFSLETMIEHQTYDGDVDDISTYSAILNASLSDSMQFYVGARRFRFQGRDPLWVTPIGIGIRF